MAGRGNKNYIAFFFSFLFYKLAYNGYHPCHNIRQASDPYNAHDEGQCKQFLVPRPLTVWYTNEKDYSHGPNSNPYNLPPAGLFQRPFK